MISDVLRRIFFLGDVHTSSLGLSTFRHQMAIGDSPQEQPDAKPDTATTISEQ